MAKGFDGKALIDILRTYMPAGASVLELGMGPGVYLEILAKYFDVTGSDNSDIFIERFRASHPDASLLHLDIIDIHTDSKFDCIYSNKVLHHLTEQELKASLMQQRNALNTDGVLFHSFWKGEGREEMQGMLLSYYSISQLKHIIGDMFDILALETYSEMADGDSLYIVLKKQPNEPLHPQPIADIRRVTYNGQK